MRRQRKSWERLRRGCGGVWRHSSGWIVRHCGHPTAHFPYYAIAPNGRMLLTGGFGLGIAFPKLVQAQEAVERQVELERASHQDNDSEPTERTQP